MKIFIVIPAYNEETKIAQVINDVKSYGQVIVVDDASTDNTKQVAQNSNAIVLSHIVNRGQGAALQTGISYALQNSADIIVNFDADGQHSAEEINEIIKPILSNEVDVVLGSRFLDKKTNASILRRIILKLAILFTKLISNINITDTHNGFRAFSRQAAQTINITQDRMAHASEILDEIIKNSLKYKEVPVTIKYTDYSRAKGQSSWNFINILKEIITGKVFN